jgi:hypothetical protein
MIQYATKFGSILVCHIPELTQMRSSKRLSTPQPAGLMSWRGSASHAVATQHVRKVADRLGFDSSHFMVRRNDLPVELPAGHDFQRARTGIGGPPSLSIAMQWFLEGGYIVSVPIEPAAYDLVTESDDGLKRVQVKSTSRRERGGAFKARLTRRIYDPETTRNNAGSYRDVPYGPGMVDYFFIITQDGIAYLIPSGAVEGAQTIVLSERYEHFKVERT